MALERRDDGVVVAMDDPGDEQVLAALESDLASPVHPVVAVRDELVRLIGQMYGPGPGTDGDWAEGRPDEGKPAPDPRAKRVQLDDLLDRVVRLGGSDLHLTVGAPPVVRLQGELRRMEGMAPLNGSDVRRHGARDAHPGASASGSSRRASWRRPTPSPARGASASRPSSSVIPSSAVLRLVPAGIPSPEDLGLPDEVIEWSDHKRGLVLVCGPHGSGTSTTLAALVDRINRARPCHILTIEQPIEFLHKHRQAIVNQREVGEDTASFERGLRYALRQDPDVLVVGELPDVDTIRHALTAAETGQLVLATLRTVDAVKTIERIVEIFPVDQQAQVRLQLATTLRGIVVQQLVPALDGGVALAVEVLLPTPEVLQCIRVGDHANLAKAIVGGVSSGMGTMDQSLAELVQEGIVDIEVAAERAVDPAELRYLTSGPT